MYTVIQSLTADGRDQSLDYKISGFHVPPGSFDAQVGRLATHNSSAYQCGQFRGRPILPEPYFNLDNLLYMRPLARSTTDTVSYKLMLQGSESWSAQ